MASRVFHSEWYEIQIPTNPTQALQYDNYAFTLARLDDECGWVIHPSLATLTERAMSGVISIQERYRLQSLVRLIKEELREKWIGNVCD